jgi:hypothetical protein
MSPSTIQVLLALDPGVDPIAGILQQPPDGDPKPFTGRLQLTQMARGDQTLRGRLVTPTHRL